VVDAEVRAIEAQLFSGYGELDRLQKDIGRRTGVGVSRWCPVPEGEKAELLHERTSEDEMLLYPSELPGHAFEPQELVGSRSVAQPFSATESAVGDAVRRISESR
jgi:hypothetical protein